jgi:GH15 family glucan-1,4-alpha-glucosidase
VLRDLVIGNGSLQVMFDAEYRLRDVYFPNLGKENHTVGHPCRFGVFADGRLSWIDSPEWERRIGYETDALVTDVTLTHRGFGLVLHVRDAVDFHENLYVREVAVKNGDSRPRDIRLFFHQDFHLYGSEVGDTALYDPRLNAVLHYKGRHYLLVNAMTPARTGVEDWAIGVKEFHGATMQQVGERLAVRTDVGGIARYERDPFLRVIDDVRAPGNPWIPCTLSLAQYRIRAARSLVELQMAGEVLEWAVRRARPSGLLPEQLDPLGKAPVSVCPLTWSHAEFIITVWDYLARRRQLASPPP